VFAVHVYADFIRTRDCPYVFIEVSDNLVVSCLTAAAGAGTKRERLGPCKGPYGSFQDGKSLRVEVGLLLRHGNGHQSARAQQEQPEEGMTPFRHIYVSLLAERVRFIGVWIEGAM
jgi:hypothetical protein